MQIAISVIIGIILGGTLGVAAMCFAQVAQCAECPYKGTRFNRDGK
ncbi:MAG: hypothetical protein IJM51_01710 [Clostridia bacterium]|nr:hypothetical protein [Clostridia bacterium]